MTQEGLENHHLARVARVQPSDLQSRRVLVLGKPLTSFVMPLSKLAQIVLKVVDQSMWKPLQESWNPEGVSGSDVTILCV